jgi:hypothetical protein
MQLIHLLLSCTFFLSCNTQSKKELMVKDTNNLSRIDTIRLRIKSPSERCLYEFNINNIGEGFYSFDKSNSDFHKIEIKITDAAGIDLVQKLFSELKNTKTFEGTLWKDGWTYTVFLNGSQKIVVYKKQESKYVTELVELFQKYAKVKIDYSCF